MNTCIITPVLNEEQQIPQFLGHLPKVHGIEHILVDGGSTDQTREIIGRYPVKLLVSSPGRGPQQNTGAATTDADTLIFLHCDTRLPENYYCAVQETLDTPGTAAGAFSLAIDHPDRPYRFIEAGANLRSRLLQLPYGDQALFMKKKTFEEAGGFPNQPILEEFALLSRLRRLGKIRIVPATATTSARRWQRLGIVKTTILNQLMLTGMALGISPYRLARLYSCW